jgi:hypothetical protein
MSKIEVVIAHWAEYLSFAGMKREEEKLIQYIHSATLMVRDQDAAIDF